MRESGAAVCRGGYRRPAKHGARLVPAVVVAMYATDDDRLTACQPFEYVELDYRPLGGMTLTRS